MNIQLKKNVEGSVLYKFSFVSQKSGAVFKGFLMNRGFKGLNRSYCPVCLNDYQKELFPFSE